MPIQFRCGACKQLLGIARRKAGQIVDCPTCRQKTRVPIVREAKLPQTAASVSVAEPPPTPPSIFDRVDVDKLLSPPMKRERVENGVTSEPGSEAKKLSSSSNGSSPVHEPKTNQRLLQNDDPVPDDQPFTLTPMPVLDTEPIRFRMAVRIVLGLAALVVFSAIFLLGHWFGAHRPLF